MKNLLPALGRQEWLRFGLRDRIIRLFHDPDAPQNEAFECSFFGRKYPGNFNTFIDWSVYYFGAYAKEELICMREFLTPLKDPIVVDVGANIGHHTLYASSLAKHVHSFEPYHPVLDKLEAKIHINGIRNVSVHKVGLGDTNQMLSFSPSTTNNTGTGTFSMGEAAENFIQLEVRTADEYFEALGIAKIDFLKMDIEGFEAKALIGMRETLRKHRPICFIEWTQGNRTGTLRNGADLFPNDYQFYEFIPPEPFMIFFKITDYRLVRLGHEWSDGNLLAVPKEYAEHVDSLNPLPSAALRLKGG